MLGGRAFVALMAVVLAARLGRAAEPHGAGRTLWGSTQLRQQWTPGVPRSSALAIPAQITRDDTVQPASLKETIALALENNPGIAARRLEPGRQEAGILVADAVFDPTLAGEVEQQHSITPNANSLAGTTTSVVDDRFANFHLLKTFRTGTLATVDFLNDRLDNNARFINLRPQYTTQLNFSVVQPLLRNFGWDFTYLVVRVAEQTADAAVYQYQAALADFVTQVIEDYWAVVRARENLVVEQDSLGAVWELVGRDPYVVNGIFERVDVHPFLQVFPKQAT